MLRCSLISCSADKVRNAFLLSYICTTQTFRFFLGVSRYKGTVVAVFPDKLKFSVDYDDGEQETLEFGKEKVRLLSTTKKA